VPSASTCCACGTGRLAPHLRTGSTGADEGFAPSTTAFGRALGDIWRCAECGHMQLEPMPSDVVLGEVYGAAADDEYVSEERGQRETAARVLQVVERHVRQARLLDLGCWVGFLLAEARDRGWDVVGVEPSQWAVEQARARGLDVRQGQIEDVDLDGGFAAVVMGDVVEHLPEPAATLDRVARLLAPGGVLVLMLPDAGSRVARLLGARWWSVVPTHVQYFTRGSLTRLLQRTGWEVLAVRTAPKAFTVGYYVGRLGGYSPAVEAAVRVLARAVRQDRRLVAPDFRDRMLVVARRR
jgi:SAM-dependent methyltransferase